MLRIRLLASLALSIALAVAPAAAPAATSSGFSEASVFSALTSPMSATAACPAGASMQIVGHPDDDLLFQSPDVLHDVQAGKCVRTVAVTAGERGDPELMLAREAGLKAAYANMAGVASSWTTADAGIGGHPMSLFTLSGKPTVSLVFTRLPEGFWGEGGTVRDEMLKNLWQGSVSQIHAEDGTSAYTKTSLTTTLTELMTAFQPDTIRTQDYVGTFGDGDHDDHHAVSYFARQAHLAYSSSHTFIGYQDYETQDKPQNVFSDDLTGKTNAFYAYLQFDEAPCGSPANCGNNDYSAWLKRQYVKATESGTDTTPPTVQSVTPASGAANVGLGTSVSATFDEAIAPASVTSTSFVLRNENGDTVTAFISANGSTATLQPNASLEPATTYTATLLSGSSGIKDAAGNALASSFIWSFTTAAADTTPPTVSTVTPVDGSGDVSLGTTVSATFSEAIAPASVTSTSFVLRDGNRNAVSASVSTSGSTATLQPSSNLEPSTTYTATLLSGPSGIKDTSGNALASDHTWSFTTAAPDTTPPTVSSVTPADGATNVSRGTNVTATFSEPISGTSVTAASFVLRDGNGDAVSASVSASGSTATLQPSTALQPSTTYTATLVSGPSGIKDSSANALASDYTWSFTTPALPTCPCSMWSPNATPQTPSVDDENSLELGVRFQSELAGYITGIRFYKGTGNTGTHVGHLWSNTGAELAAATFTNETATGWQQVTFSSPVAISANTPYVASYLAPAGHFALDRPYFTTAHDNPPLQALADGSAAGANGVYRLGSGFPNSSFQASNYWVDVVFVTSLVDTKPPMVSSVTPANAAASVDPGTSVSANFSEPIAPTSVTSTSFVLRDGNGNAVSASASASGSTATLRPSSNLQPSTTYTATLVSGSNGIKDLAGNPLASDVTWSFTTATPDITPPSSTVGFPAAAGNYNAASWTAGCAPAGICGTASDDGTGVQRVEVSIRRVSTNRWWTGTGYTSTTERWFVATGTTSWNFALASSTFAAGSYVVRVRATDNSGTVESPSTTTFIYDNSDPNSTVTFPVNNGSYTTATWNAGCAFQGICGTASDAVSGVKSVQVSIRRGTGNYWNGTSFSSRTEVFLTATGTTIWSFSFPASNFQVAARYRIRVRATDNAKNDESPSMRTINFTP